MTLEELQADFAARMQEQHERAALALEESARRSQEARERHELEMGKLKSALYEGRTDEYIRDYYQRIIGEGTAGASQGMDGGTPAVGAENDAGQPGEHEEPHGENSGVASQQ